MSFWDFIFMDAPLKKQRTEPLIMPPTKEMEFSNVYINGQIWCFSKEDAEKMKTVDGEYLLYRGYNYHDTSGIAARLLGYQEEWAKVWVNHSQIAMVQPWLMPGKLVIG